MKLTLSFVIFAIVVIISMGITISFKPFKINVDTWLNGLAMILMFASFSILIYNHDKKVKQEGYEECIEDFKKLSSHLTEKSNTEYQKQRND